MKEPVAYQDAVDLLDADHKAVKKMFIDFDALCEDGASPKQKRALAQRICQALTVHALIEEEIFYPQVRDVTGDDSMLDEALEEHAEAKQLIGKIEAMKPSNEAFDQDLKRRNAEWGVRAIEDMAEIARTNGLELVERVSMPANNVSLVFRR